MYKVPVKHKKAISQEFKTFLPLISSLISKGKLSTEEDARILLNDMLHSILGYNKFNELKTEIRDKNGRMDYVVKLTDGPNKNKPDRYDFVIEAKACSVELNQSVIDQTLTYCLTSGLDYFIITNAQKWQLFRVKRQGKVPTANLIHEVSLSSTTNIDMLAEEFYLFSKAAYVNGDWKRVSEVKAATKVEDVVAVLLCDKTLKLIARELTSEHEVKVDEESIKDILESTILKQWAGDYNKRLLKKLNEKTVKKPNEEVSLVTQSITNGTDISESSPVINTELSPEDEATKDEVA